jgi:hypothetical protein
MAIKIGRIRMYCLVQFIVRVLKAAKSKIRNARFGWTERIEYFALTLALLQLGPKVAAFWGLPQNQAVFRQKCMWSVIV